MPPQLSDLDAVGGIAQAAAPLGPPAPARSSAAETVASGGSSLEADLASQQARHRRLLAELETAPEDPVGAEALLSYTGPSRTKRVVKEEIVIAERAIASLNAQIKAAVPPKPDKDVKPPSEFATGNVPKGATKAMIASMANQDLAAGVSQANVLAKYGPFGWLPAIGDQPASVDEAILGAANAGGGRGSSGLAAAGARLKALLQYAIQEKRIKLDTAKAISKDYFDALTESRQREQLSQDAFATAQKANSDYLQTERNKLDLLSPENARLFQSEINSLGQTAGSNFRIPDSWVEGQQGVQVNADVLGGNYAAQQPKDIQNMLETVGRTPDAINSRILAGAAVTNGGSRPAASDLPFTAGQNYMTPEEERQVVEQLRSMGIDPMGDLTAGDNKPGLGDLGE